MRILAQQLIHAVGDGEHGAVTRIPEQSEISQATVTIAGDKFGAVNLVELHSGAIRPNRTGL